MEPRATAHDTGNREFTVERLIDAPRSLVFPVWSEPEHLAKWFGPNGFTNTILELDVRVGGVWRHVMHEPDGVDYQNKSIFTEVVPLERLAYTHYGPDEDNPVLFDATVTFEEVGAGTRVTMHAVFPTADDLKFLVENYRAIESAEETLANLAEYLAETTIQR